VRLKYAKLGKLVQGSGSGAGSDEGHT
jgi:hypothetical protein